jgi:hypothetical protein
MSQSHLRAAPASTPFPFDQLEPHIAQRVRAEAIETCEGWRALGRRRKLIFGIVPSACARIDNAVRAAERAARRGIACA